MWYYVIFAPSFCESGRLRFIFLPNQPEAAEILQDLFTEYTSAEFQIYCKNNFAKKWQNAEETSSVTLVFAQ